MTPGAGGDRGPMSGQSGGDYADDYTDPQLRERLKEEIKAGDRGGRPGQWSARKSQLLTHEYEKQGGGYTREGERTESQEHLRQWTAQDWTTSDGDADARASDGTRRYLPEAAWQLLDDDEKEATDRPKLGSAAQHVPNTVAAREARAAAEILDMNAPDARRAVRAMEEESQLDRAEQAEKELGTARTTVLGEIEKQRGRS